MMPAATVAANKAQQDEPRSESRPGTMSYCDRSAYRRLTMPQNPGSNCASGPLHTALQSSNAMVYYDEGTNKKNGTRAAKQKGKLQSEQRKN
jgi:hypothetical protein